jgi:hypothetical protein
MSVANDAPRRRRIGSRRRRLAPNSPAPDLRVLASTADVPLDERTERVELLEFDWLGDHGRQTVILRSTTLLD